MSEDLPTPHAGLQTDPQQRFSPRELRALGSIEQYFVGSDYWEDATIRKYRAAGLVHLSGDRILLTDAGREAASETVG